MRNVFLLSSCVFLLLSCGRTDLYEGSEEIAISRALEQAIEIGEKYLSDRELIENVAWTEGTDAACKLYNELHHRANYEAFWECLETADSIWRQVPDSLKRQEIVYHIMPYVDRIIILADDIMP